MEGGKVKIGKEWCEVTDPALWHDCKTMDQYFTIKRIQQQRPRPSITNNEQSNTRRGLQVARSDP